MSVSGKRRGRHPREGERQREGGYDERETRRRGSNLFIVILFGTLRKPNARWRRDGRQSAREGGGTRRGGNPSRRDVAPRCRRSEAGGCARTVLRAVLGVFARRCSPPTRRKRPAGRNSPPCSTRPTRSRRQPTLASSPTASSSYEPRQTGERLPRRGRNKKNMPAPCRPCLFITPTAAVDTLYIFFYSERNPCNL